MKTKSVRMLGVTSGVMLLPFIALPLGGCHGAVLRTQKDADANSGDIRKRVCLLGVQISEQITESPFSHEIRRLGIRTPETRNWKPMIVSSAGGRLVGEPYNAAIWDCNHLLELLDMLGVSEAERRAILQQVVSNLQTGKLNETADLVYDVADRLGVKYGLPSTPKEKRPKSDDRYLKG